jgi:glycosyltransferase involved in cell wall biosynthesis
MVAVHQFLASLAPRDAQSQHHLHIRDALRGAGYASDLYVGEAKGEFRAQAQPFRAYCGAPGDWLLYGHAIGTPVAEFVVSRPEPMILDYHNVTPAAMFEAWEPSSAIRMAAGRRQLAPLAARCRLGLADSAFNETELRGLGARRTAVVPIMIDTKNFATAPAAKVLDALSDSRSRGARHLLFVGRLAPNKRQHELVAALAALRTGFDIDARLHLVGASASDRYRRTLIRFIEALGLGRAVTLVGSAAPADLAAYYEGCDAFVSASAHEGFLVPLLEAWHHRLPVVASPAAAVGETMGDAGVRVRRPTPIAVAAAAARVLGDDALRAELVARGLGRLDDFALDRSRERLLDAVASVVAP